MNRRTFAVTSLAACSGPTLGIVAAKPGVARESVEFRFDEAKELELKSSPVKWQGGDVHLLTLNQFLFSLDASNKTLTARVKGSLLTFDDIDYTIAIAVFGSDGKMLGASTTVCHVPRIWLGIYGQQPVNLSLDFGVSNNFSQAARFQASISERTVLTPDQWQKGKD